ncbi:acyltransferase domain-containing protein [Vibrio penaeicida]|uniref:acyltransferase domain-containing protein n=1 Tax=Vibrio penaeicida TaxID=104609 RepID=UPI0027340888|nr:acyltransferase domain-containing protein [Vibrio penaeicida]MDP2571204.1 acyltransferase domain-containing protein [Vibrio penaeicida]
MFHPEKRQDFMLDNQEAKTLFMQSGSSITDRSIIDSPITDSPITGLGNTNTPSYGPNHFNHIHESMGGSSSYSRSKPAVVFMFSGLEEQPHRCARSLYENFEFFHERVEECLWHLTKIDVHLADETEFFFSECQVHSKQPVSQVQLYVFEYALASTLIHWGVKPDALIGDSLGEYVAGCISGLLNIEDVLAMVCSRQRLMDDAQAGAMFAVPKGKAEVVKWLDDWNKTHPSSDQKISLSYVSTPHRCVVSGGAEPLSRWLDQYVENAESGEYVSQRYALHSNLMTDVSKTLGTYIEGIPSYPIHTPFVSTITGRWVQQGDVEHSQYWASQIQQTVQFAKGLQCVSEDLGSCILIEIGLGESMSKLVEQQRINSLCAFPLLPDILSEDLVLPANFPCDCILTSVKTLGQYGVNIRWDRILSKTESDCWLS